jgi:hypothetical protein
VLLALLASTIIPTHWHCRHPSPPASFLLRLCFFFFYASCASSPLSRVVTIVIVTISRRRIVNGVSSFLLSCLCYYCDSYLAPRSSRSVSKLFRYSSILIDPFQIQLVVIVFLVLPHVVGSNRRVFLNGSPLVPS